MPTRKQLGLVRASMSGLAWSCCRCHCMAAGQSPAPLHSQVKSDEHMAKVKEQLVFERNQIEAAEARRREREAKKFGKQVSCLQAGASHVQPWLRCAVAASDRHLFQWSGLPLD